MMDVSKIDPAKYLHVDPINPEAGHMHDALGITEERKEELQKLAKEAYFTTDKFTAAAERGSLSCKHANELMFMVFLLSDIRSNIQDPLSRILSMISHKGGPGGGQ